MQTLTDYVKHVNEVLGQPIDDQWLDNEKPVMTKDKRHVIITDRDMSQVPNMLKGQVKIMNKMFDYEWEDNGNCIKAVDQYGNPKKPTDSDNLVKAS